MACAPGAEGTGGRRAEGKGAWEAGVGGGRRRRAAEAGRREALGRFSARGFGFGFGFGLARVSSG